MTDTPDDTDPKKPRSPAERYKGNNDGGYCNAPVKDQFKPGNKGGPGRPKKPQSIAAAVRQMLRSKVPKSDGGSIPMPEAIALGARKSILQGGIKGIELALKLDGMFPQVNLKGIKERKKVLAQNYRSLTDFELAISLALTARLETGIIDVGNHAMVPNEMLGLCRIVRRADGMIGFEPHEEPQRSHRPSLAPPDPSVSEPDPDPDP